MADPQQLAGRQVVARILADEVKKLADFTRSELEPLLDTEEAVAAKLPDGTRLGKVMRSKPSVSVSVVDRRALLEFVKEAYPEEIVTTEEVNAAFLNVLIAQVKHGTDIPGLEERYGSSSYRVTPSADAKDIVRSRLAELLSGGVLKIGGAE